MLNFFLSWFLHSTPLWIVLNSETSWRNAFFSAYHQDHVNRRIVYTSYTQIKVANMLSIKKHLKINICGSVETNLTSIYEDAGLIPGLAQRVEDLELLWLWCRPAATAPIWPLAWEPLYAVGAALKRQKKKNQLPKLRYVSQDHCIKISLHWN